MTREGSSMQDSSFFFNRGRETARKIGHILFPNLAMEGDSVHNLYVDCTKSTYEKHRSHFNLFGHFFIVRPKI